VVYGRVGRLTDARIAMETTGIIWRRGIRLIRLRLSWPIERRWQVRGECLLCGLVVVANSDREYKIEMTMHVARVHPIEYEDATGRTADLERLSFEAAMWGA
jgi:hypothetical protein